MLLGRFKEELKDRLARPPRHQLFYFGACVFGRYKKERLERGAASPRVGGGEGIWWNELFSEQRRWSPGGALPPGGPFRQA